VDTYPICPPQMETTAPTSLILPDTLPVMVLADCCLFPGCQLPLFIFEERYRRMLSHALENHRMFCIGTRQERQADCTEVFPCSTAGLVRLCKTQPDGTSHVLLTGLQRIRLLDWVGDEPCLQARIEPIVSIREQGGNVELETLRRQALKLIPDLASPVSQEPFADICRQLADDLSPEAACDYLAHRFVRRISCALRLLAEPCVEARYRILIGELERLRASA